MLSLLGAACAADRSTTRDTFRTTLVELATSTVVGSTGGDATIVTPKAGPTRGDSELVTIATLQNYNANGEVIVWEATQRLIGNCMRKLGFEYHEIPSEDIAGNRALADKVDNMDLSIASTAGYHPDAISVDSSLQAALTAYNAAAEQNAKLAAANPAFTVALEGPLGGAGCVKDAAVSMYGDTVPLPELFRSLVGAALDDIYKQVAADSDVVGATKKWSECMAGFGFRYSSPGQARGPYLSAATVSPEEIATATRDSECRSSSHLPAVTRATESKYVRAFLDQHPGVFEQLAAAALADISAAKRVMLN